MKAFHGDPAIKQKYLDRLAAHRAADHLIRGTGWDDHRGCAIGCTLDKYEHARYPVELGLPTWLAHLVDRLFESLPGEQAMELPERVLSAIRPGADVQLVKHRLTIRRMDRLIAAQQDNAYPAKDEMISAIRAVRACAKAAIGVDACDWSAAESAAESAAYTKEAEDLIELLGACNEQS